MVNILANGGPLEPFAAQVFPTDGDASYVPAPLPRRFGMSSELREIVDEAEWALGRLSGVTEFLDDLEVLARPLQIGEALASAGIDGTRVSLAEILIADSDSTARARSAIRQVMAVYDMATIGSRLVGQGPITRHVLAELHRTLMAGIGGATDEAHPFRDSTHLVRVPGAGSDTLKSVPSPTEFPSLLADWEHYLTTPPPLPRVLRTALVYHRIDTIHPFIDGTGAVSRAVVSLLLSGYGGSRAPILGISRPISKDLLGYHQSLSTTTDIGDIEPWVAYFAKLVHQEATRVHGIVASLHQLRQTMREEARAEALSVFAFVNILFAHPIISAPLLKATLDLPDRHVDKVIVRAEKIGWIRPLWRPDSTATPYWWAPDIWAVHSPDAPTF